MKILFLPKWYPAKRDPQNGVFIQKHALAAAHYHEVAVLYVESCEKKAGKFKVEWRESEKLKECRLYYSFHRTGLSGFDLILGAYAYVKATLAGWKLLKEQWGKPDICHVHVLKRPAFLALYLNIFEQIPFVITEHWSGYMDGRFAAQEKFQRSLANWIVSRASAITAVSEPLLNALKTAFPLVTPIILENVVESSGTDVYPIPDEHKFLSIADLNDDIKNISSVIKCVAELSKDYPDIEYHIIGGGPDEEMLRNLAAQLGVLDQNVFFHGRMSNEEVLLRIPEHAFLVVNSRYETFSIVILEALLAGRPVISTKCGGPEHIMDERMGVLIPVDDEQALMTAIRKMLETASDYSPRQLSGMMGERYSPEHIGKELDHLYSSVVG